MKLRYSAQFFALIVLTSQAIYAGPPIESIIQQVLKAKSTKRIDTFIDNAKQPYLINSSEKINSQKLNHLKKTAPMLTDAILQLHAIPGFESALHNALTSLGQSNCVGYVYEIKKAKEITQAHIEKKRSEKVVSMNTKIHAPNDPYGTTFDIITTEQYIECKAINWENFTKKLRDQFFRQQKVLAYLNITNGTSHQYAIHTPTDISVNRLKWFERHGISVVVDEKN